MEIIFPICRASYINVSRETFALKSLLISAVFI
jgi:hypothetical protein